MSQNRLHSNAAFLCLLCQANPMQRKQLIRTATKEQLQTLCECAYNILQRNVHLSPHQTTNLRRYKNLVYKLADRSIALPTKRRALNNQSGGFLPALLAPILGTVLGVVAERLIPR